MPHKICTLRVRAILTKNFLSFIAHIMSMQIAYDSSMKIGDPRCHDSAWSDIPLVSSKTLDLHGVDKVLEPFVS
jgi:hypothetical protein